MSHFRNILRHRQKQISLGTFLVKLPIFESSTVFSEAKRQKTEEPPEKLPKIVLETMNTSPLPPLPRHHPVMSRTPLNTGKVKLNFILFLCN